MKKLNFKKVVSKKISRKQRKLFVFFLVKLGFKDTAVLEKLIKARRVITMMTDNPNFPNPSPTLASVTAITNNLQAAEAAMDGRKLKTAERNAVLKSFVAEITALQAYVENVSGKDVEIILSSGFDVRNPNNKPSQLPSPEQLISKNTEVEGQIKLKWKTVKGSKMYMVEFKPAESTPTADWSFITQSTKASTTINNLEPGQKYSFRIVAVNAAGRSGWSGITICRPN